MLWAEEVYKMFFTEEELKAFQEKLMHTWESLKEELLLVHYVEPIHPAAKLKHSKQRIHSLVTIRKPMMIRARTCC
ncbi:hypothetical protein NCCP28_06080 [Niallia sp. NCCP-28]|nr:hypothetical protein NCCP28_06080 [Niallia sp. NCCP-28]